MYKKILSIQIKKNLFIKDYIKYIIYKIIYIRHLIKIILKQIDKTNVLNFLLEKITIKQSKNLLKKRYILNKINSQARFQSELLNIVIQILGIVYLLQLYFYIDQFLFNAA